MERRRTAVGAFCFAEIRLLDVIYDLSLGEDRCEGENDKLFTRSALIESVVEGG